MTHPLTPAEVAAYLANQETNEKRTADNKLFVNETSRPIGTKIYFTSKGDNVAVKTDIGNGELLNLTHTIGDPTTQEVVIDLNMEANLTYIHEGYVMWKDADFDDLTLTIIPRVSTYEAGTNTNYNLYGGYLIIPAAGNGTVTPTLIQLVEMPVSTDTGLRSAAFWNATWNKTTGQYDDITPAPTGNGVYNMFAVEVTLGKFVNHFLLLNSGFMMLQSAESEQLGAGMRVKLTIATHNTDHNWKAAVGLVFHRQKGC